MNFRAKLMMIFALAIVLALVAPAAFASTQNAVLYGAVYDATGNPAGGITVTLQNSSIGFSRSTVTGADGSYNFAEVPPAENYVIAASRNGGQIDARSGIVVNVGDEKVLLPPLKERPVEAATTTTTTPGKVAPTPMAETQTVTNETVSTAISGVINGEQLRSLPVAINRNFLNAGVIPPETHDVQQGSQLAGATFSVNGNRGQSNDFLLDGTDNVASSSNQAVPFQVNDSVQEFRVTSSTANAEYGRNMGGTVNIVTKRAGNGFHGSTFGYFNNDALNANSPLSVYNGSTFDKAAAYAGPLNPSFNPSAQFPFSPQSYNQYVADEQAFGICTNSLSPAATPGSVPCGVIGDAGGTPVEVFSGLFGQNQMFNPASVLATHNSNNIPFDSKQFGANAGGAIIPDKLFAFGSYEGTLINNPNPIFERVPSAFDRTFNPYGSTSFGFTASNPNYVLDQKILSLFPQPNVVGVPGVLEFFQGQAPNYTNVHNGLFRGDYTYSEKTNFTLRYVIQNLSQLHDDTLPEQSQYAGNGALRGALNQNLDLSASHTFSSTVVSDVRFGYNRFSVNETPQDQGLDTGALGLPGGLLPTILLNGLDPQYSGAQPGLNGGFAGWSDTFVGLERTGVFPTLDGFFPFARLGAPLGAPLDHRDTTWFLAGSTSWTLGKHGIKFGVESRRITNHLTDGSFSRGFMYSGDIGQFTSDSESCNEECLRGTGGAAINAFRAPSFDFFQQQPSPYTARLLSYGNSAYIQDSWHIHPRVTINAGVRYEYFSPPTEANDQLYNYDPSALGLVQEGHNAVIDPYGNPCTPTVGAFPGDPKGGTVGFSPGNGIWNCAATSTNGTNSLVRDNRLNFAPRVGVAWDVFGNGKTVLRGGAGIFYDEPPANYLAQLMYNRPSTTNNALFGTVLPGLKPSLCPVSFFTCGLGSTIVQPGVQNAISADGVNTNGFYSALQQPFAIYAEDTAHSRTPYSRQYSFTVQQQITGRLTAEIGYIGEQAFHLPAVYNANLANEANVLLNGTDGNLSLFPIFTLTNQARSHYNSLMLRLRAAEWHGLSVNGSYIWSKSIDNASDSVFPPLPVTMANSSIGYGVFGQDNPVADCIFLGTFCPSQTGTAPTVISTPLTLPVINFSPGAVTTTGAGQVITSRYLIPQDPGNFLVNDRGLSDFDVRNRGVIDYIWQVPTFGTGSALAKWTNNWQLSGVFTAQSGQPYTIFAGPIAGEITQRVNVVGAVQTDNNNPQAAISGSGLQLASASAACNLGLSSATFIGNFIQPQPGQTCNGDSGRNAFTGPGYINMNFAVQKGFAVFGEGRILTFRTEFYNLFNHPNFYNPISTYSVDGQTVNPDFGKIKSAYNPREIQFAMRFSW